MGLVIAHSIREEEFGGDLIPAHHIAVLRRSMAVGLGTTIKGEGLPKATRLLKIHATSPEGARRIVHLLAVADNTLFLLFYRDKKDPVGKNITIQNRDFRRQLHKHLDLLKVAIHEGSYTVLDDQPS